MNISLKTRLGSLSVPTLVALICLIHVALLIWQALVVQINNDGILYVRGARLFAEGHFAEARQLFPWFTYPLLLGGGMKLTGIDAWPLALIVDGVASTLTVLVVLRCVWLLVPQREALIAAGLLLLGNLWFNDLRATIVREHFYFLLMLIGFYFTIRDLQTPGWRYRAGFLLCTLAAGLFRIEAFGFVVLVSAVRVAFEARSRPLRIAAVLALALAPVGALLLTAFWSDAGNLGALLSKPRGRIDILRDQVLAPFESRKATFAYAAMVFGLLLYGLVNAMGLATVAMTGFAWADRRIRSSAPFRAAFAYLLAGLVIYAAQIYFNIVFDYRHGLVMSLIFTPVAAAGLLALWRAARDRTALRPRVLLGVVIALLITGLLVGIRKYDAQHYRYAAAAWLQQNLPPTARISSNSNQILFYGGFVNTTPQVVVGFGAEHPDPALFADWASYDAVVLEIRHSKLGYADALNKRFGTTPAKVFENGRGDEIFIYRRAP
ncbi:hypothetical protein [Rhodopseudomonas sp. B29]|uniref:hypothetical protein n=1 Tax=Rhodopseudomonas sp. B29 TaxID=95607 RepID=UPI00034D11A8|nr:hypothetical protein [Rhodopseudomonas sp. B29]